MGGETSEVVKAETSEAVRDETAEVWAVDFRFGPAPGSSQGTIQVNRRGGWVFRPLEINLSFIHPDDLLLSEFVFTPRYNPIL